MKKVLLDMTYLTLEVPEILHYPEIPSGVKLTLPFIDVFYILKFQLTQPYTQWTWASYFMNKSDLDSIPE